MLADLPLVFEMLHKAVGGNAKSASIAEEKVYETGVQSQCVLCNHLVCKSG
jgi:hypothetical protein